MDRAALIKGAAKAWKVTHATAERRLAALHPMLHGVMRDHAWLAGDESKPDDMTDTCADWAEFITGRKP